MVFFLVSVRTRPARQHTCKLYTPSGFKDAYWAEAFSPSHHLFSIPHCPRSSPQMHVCMLQCQAVLHCLSLTHFLSVWAVIHVCPLSLSLSHWHIYPRCLCADCFPQPFFSSSLMYPLCPGDLQEVQRPLSICGLCIKCHGWRAECQWFTSRWGAGSRLYT